MSKGRSQFAAGVSKGISELHNLFALGRAISNRHVMRGSCGIVLVRCISVTLENLQRPVPDLNSSLGRPIYARTCAVTASCTVPFTDPQARCGRPRILSPPRRRFISGETPDRKVVSFACLPASPVVLT